MPRTPLPATGRSARTIWHGTDRLTPPLAAAIEAKVLPRAQAQTTGQIRAKIRRLVKKLDPETLERRRALAEKQRGVHLVESDDGTAHLTGTDLPTQAASAAYHRLNAIAAAIKNDGDTRGIDQLRADVFLAILRGTLTTTQVSSSNQVRSSNAIAEPAGSPMPPPALQTTTSMDTARRQPPAIPGASPIDQRARQPPSPDALSGKPRENTPAAEEGGIANPIAEAALCDKPGTDAPTPGAEPPNTDGHKSPDPKALHDTARTDAPAAGTEPPSTYRTAMSQHPKLGDAASGCGRPGPGSAVMPGWADGGIANLIAGAGRCDKSRMSAPSARAGPLNTDGTTAPQQPEAGETASAYERSRPNSTAAAGWGGVDDGIADLIAGAARTELSAIAEHHRGLLAEAATLISGSLADLKARWCVPDHDRTGYRPPAAIRRLIEHRDRRCCYPSCRRPVRHCDADHTIPHQQGGPTCFCNLAMLCRRHHRLKQTKNWQIHHIWPGVILWITPTGHWTITTPADRE